MHVVGSQFSNDVTRPIEITDFDDVDNGELLTALTVFLGNGGLIEIDFVWSSVVATTYA